MKPVIGITLNEDLDSSTVFLSQYYFRAIVEAGGTPLLIPPVRDAQVIEQVLEIIDGLVLAGGGDIDPIHINEEPLVAMGRITPDRDYTELELAKGALKKDLAIMAICRGMQLLNIAGGGTIYQDINSQIGKVLKHDQEAPKWYPTHAIEVDQSSLLFDITAAQNLRVNSFHHQAVAKPGLGFKLTGYSKDGVVEALESEKHKFVLGVQWHPECMWDKDPHSFKIFRRFVKEAGS